MGNILTEDNSEMIPIKHLEKMRSFFFLLISFAFYHLHGVVASFRNEYLAYGFGIY